MEEIENLHQKECFNTKQTVIVSTNTVKIMAPVKGLTMISSQYLTAAYTVEVCVSLRRYSSSADL